MRKHPLLILTVSGFTVDVLPKILYLQKGVAYAISDCDAG